MRILELVEAEELVETKAGKPFAARIWANPKGKKPTVTIEGDIEIGRGKMKTFDLRGDALMYQANVLYQSVMIPSFTYLENFHRILPSQIWAETFHGSKLDSEVKIEKSRLLYTAKFVVHIDIGNYPDKDKIVQEYVEKLRELARKKGYKS